MNPLMIKLIGLAGIGILAAAAFFYVQHLQDSLKIEKANNAVLMDTVKSAKQSVDNLRNDVQAIQTGVTAMNAELAKSRKDVQDLNKRFTETKSGEKRNLENLAAKHPKLIEDAINRGTKEAARCNQLVTGAKPEPGEKNSICPGLLK